MFGGIISVRGVLFWIDPYTISVTVSNNNSYFEEIVIGDSIAIDGICLTVVKIERQEKEVCLFFQLSEETISRTHLKNRVQRSVNVERPLKKGDFLGGHFCSGHVNTTGSLFLVEKKGVAGCFDIFVRPAEWSPSLFIKNSVCINGVSLTIASISVSEESFFSVSLISHTVQNTTFGDILPTFSDPVEVNIEFAVSVSLATPDQPLNAWTNQDEKEKHIDALFMRQAMEQGMLGRFTAPPNPWVGCLIVSGDQKTVLGVGYHARAGQAHAEIKAFQDADKKGFSCEGSILYVTLEPCHHHGKTPPCDIEIVQRRVKRVVVGVTDPDHRVSGKGIDFLREKGIVVDVLAPDDGLRKEIEWSLRSYLYQRSTGIPWCVVKAGVSLDGFICDGRGKSKWITCDESRQEAHKLRAASQCILVGAQTALIDKPTLNVRLEDTNRFNMLKPLRAILDCHLSCDPREQTSLFNPEYGETIVFFDKKVENKDALTKKFINSSALLIGVDCISPNQLNLRQVLTYLTKRGVLQVLVEGGPTVHASFLQSPFVSEVVLFRSPKILGPGPQSRLWSDLLKPLHVNQEPMLEVKEVKKLGKDIMETFIVTDTTTSKVKRALQSFSQGDFVIVMDDEDRENEGDLISRADMMTPEKMTFLLKYSTGIVCVCMTEERAQQLQLPLMVPSRNNTDNYGTAFTITCDAIDAGTGVSALNRTKTVKALANGNASSLRKPGHIFPLIARSGLLSERAGHTEASVTLCKLCSFFQENDSCETAVICELQDHETGEMMRRPQCEKLAEMFNIPLITVQQLKLFCDSIDFWDTLKKPEKSVFVKSKNPLSSCELNLFNRGAWDFYCFDSGDEMYPHRVLVKGNVEDGNECLLRIHSECYTGDTLHSCHCDCGDQLRNAMSLIEKKDRGIIIILANHEGRGIGLTKKIEAYRMMQTDKEINTFEANVALGFKEDERNYDDVDIILKHFHISRVSLLSDNPFKSKWLKDHGYEVTHVRPVDARLSKFNKSYMKCKKEYFLDNTE